jgi:hydroxymethylpyrimidine/phosphomethylpyrimidine kinase
VTDRVRPARILIIAGSDSGGGAGIQADIKTVTMLGGYAMTAVTAVTAQNTLGVSAVHLIPTETVIAQIDAVVSDIGVDAVKIGMIGSAETAAAMAHRLNGLGVPIVFDPVMVATSGDALADAATIAAFGRLMRRATVVTPNLPELDALGGVEAVLKHGCALLEKGGHGTGDLLIDRLHADGAVTEWQSPRIDTTSTHGTGCTLASAIATGLAQGMPLLPAVARARDFVRLALLCAPMLGAGHGPMGHQAVRLDCGPDLRLNQFVVPLKDYAASRDFYRALGLTLIVDAPENGYARFEAPGGATLSLHGDEAGVNFECDDLEGTIASARAAGIDFEGPVDQPWLWREAWTRDPSGNRVLLYQAGENRRFPPWRLP